MRFRVVVTAVVAMIAFLAAGIATADATAYNRYIGPNYTSRAILTFDDCPTSLASFEASVLWAEAHNVGLVLAPTGICLDQYRAKYGINIAHYARVHGQWVINHSYDHPDLTTLTTSQIFSQLTRRLDINYGRPPYGATDAKVDHAYALAGMREWLWNVDTNDWQGKSRSQVVSYIVANCGHTDTCLMHMQWRGFNPTALHLMRKGLRAKGVKVCRAYHGSDRVGPVTKTPRNLPDDLPC